MKKVVYALLFLTFITKLNFFCKGKSQKSLLSVKAGAQRQQSQCPPIFYESIKDKLRVSLPGLGHTSKFFSLCGTTLRKWNLFAS